MLNVLVLGAVAGLLVWLVVAAARAHRPGNNLPCATCANCGKLFDDGVLCRFGNREVFKTEAHIANCMDYRRRA
jgi:hypothetical protein